jgi:uncharacterized membrane protein YGL010W
MDTLFTRQFRAYASYHRDPRNRLTHFIGIPAIIFALLVVLALSRISLFGLTVSAAWIVAAIAVVGWISLDAVIGAAMLVAMVPMLLIADWIATRFSATTAWIVFAVFFIGGWVFQLAGHAMEGRRPALIDNLFQAFIGPMFITAELLMMLGFKQDLHAVIGDAEARQR